MSRHPKCLGTYDEWTGDYDCEYGATITCDECKYGVGRKDPAAKRNQPMGNKYERDKVTPAQTHTHATRRAQILTAAVAMTRTHGYRGVTRDAVALKAGVAAGLVNRYFGTMRGLMDAVMQDAIEHRSLVIIAQGLAHGDAVALAAPGELRSAALAAVGGDL